MTLQTKDSLRVHEALSIDLLGFVVHFLSIIGSIVHFDFWTQPCELNARQNKGCLHEFVSPIGATREETSGRDHSQRTREPSLGTSFLISAVYSYCKQKAEVLRAIIYDGATLLIICDIMIRSVAPS